MVVSMPKRSAPIVTAQTATQYFVGGAAENFRLPGSTFFDPQNSALTFSATLASGLALPYWLKFNAVTATFTGTPPVGAGAFSVRVTATNGFGLSASESFSFLPAAPPVVVTATQDQTWITGQAVNFTLSRGTFVDPQGGPLTVTASLSNGSSLPAWLHFSSTTGIFSGVVPAGTANFAIKVTAIDALGLSASETFKVVTHGAPVVSAPTASPIWVVGVAETLRLAAGTFVDPQGASLTLSATTASGAALPAWLKFNAATQSFSGTEPAGSAPLTIRVTATNPYGLSVSENITFYPAGPPVLAAQTAGQSWVQGQTVNFVLPARTFTDPQGSLLTLSATLANGGALPIWLKFNPATGAFSGTEPAGTAGFSIRVTATDSFGLAASEIFAVTTPAPAVPPTPPATGMVINVTYDSSTSAAPTGFFSAVQWAVNYIKAEFTNAMTLNIKFGYGSVNGSVIGTGALGASQSNYSFVSYATLVKGLSNHAVQPDQQTALASLPTLSPMGGAAFIVANAEARALGLVAANGTALDGAVGLSSTYAMNWDPTNRAVAGKYDAVGVLLHEITEVMGRTGSLGANSNAYTPLDLFRYTSPGMRDLIPGAGNFSIDGKTMLQAYNNPLNGGDAVDWAPSVVGDSFGSGRTGVAGLVTAVDLREMNVLGYTRASLTS